MSIKKNITSTPHIYYFPFLFLLLSSFFFLFSRIIKNARNPHVLSIYYFMVLNNNMSLSFFSFRRSLILILLCSRLCLGWVLYIRITKFFIFKATITLLLYLLGIVLNEASTKLLLLIFLSLLLKIFYV